MPFGVTLRPPIGADLAMLSDGSGGIVLDGWGGLQHLGVPSVVPTGALPYWPGWDIARGLAFLPDRSGGYLLDGYGGIHELTLGSGAPQLNTTTFMSGLSNPWDLAFTPDGHADLHRAPERRLGRERRRRRPPPAPAPGRPARRVRGRDDGAGDRSRGSRRTGASTSASARTPRAGPTTCGSSASR